MTTQKSTQLVKAKSNMPDAFHEAGHAVAACLVRYHPKEVTIIPTEDYLGQCRQYGFKNYYPDASSDRRTNLMTKKRIFVLVSGPVAEAFYRSLEKTGVTNSDKYEERFNADLPLMGKIPEDEKYDLNKAVGLASSLTGDVQAGLAYLNFMWFYAGSSLRYYWPAVRSMATELIKRKTMNGRDIVREFKKATKDFATVVDLI